MGVHIGTIGSVRNPPARLCPDKAEAPGELAWNQACTKTARPDDLNRIRAERHGARRALPLVFSSYRHEQISQNSRHKAVAPKTSLTISHLGGRNRMTILIIPLNVPRLL